MTPYRDSWEHLEGELARLDRLLAEAVAASRERRRHDPLEQLRGLVVSDEEVDTLLEPTLPGQPLAPSPELTEFTRQIDRRVALSLEHGVPLALPDLAQRFGLGRFEARVLVLCLAPELDRRYDKLYAYLHDDVTRKRPSVGLALELAGDGAAGGSRARHAAFAADAPLRRHLLIAAGDGSGSHEPLIARPLKLDDRIAARLLGSDRLDGRLDGLVRQIDPASQAAPSGPAAEIAGRLAPLTEALCENRLDGRKQLIVHLRGRYGSGRLALAAAAARQLGAPLLVVDAARLTAADRARRSLVRRLAREAHLRSAVLAIESFDDLLRDEPPARQRLGELSDALSSYGRATFLLGEERWLARNRPDGALLVSHAVARPGDADRLALWRDGIGRLGSTELTADAATPGTLGRLASEFRFTPGQIGDALAGARDLAAWRRGPRAVVEESDLNDACRAQATPALARLARRVETSCGWDDLILPGAELAHLRELCDQARRRHVVFGAWGFGQKLRHGRGLSALFSGPPGTGKTHAAAIIARELGLDLFKIDLSQVVSKYIGETEKNLDRIFTAAEDANAILFFDEADALFGKRSEVRDSHDRYANVEVSYLLQKMEECEGFTILATNLRQHLDDAFLRRLAVVIEFPFPGAAERERIWRVTLPEQAPLGDDVDLGELARQVRLAGGNIKNISLAAAFYAASDGQVIRMEHLWRASRREFQKLGRAWKEHPDRAAAGNLAAPSGAAANGQPVTPPGAGGAA